VLVGRHYRYLSLNRKTASVQAYLRDVKVLATLLWGVWWNIRWYSVVRTAQSKVRVQWWQEEEEWIWRPFELITRGRRSDFTRLGYTTLVKLAISFKKLSFLFINLTVINDLLQKNDFLLRDRVERLTYATALPSGGPVVNHAARKIPDRQQVHNKWRLSHFVLTCVFTNY
jgi:hypothetical protein